MHHSSIVYVILTLLVNTQQSEVENSLKGPLRHRPLFQICSSNIYCRGKLLETVQLSKLFDSSKEFVNMQMLRDEKTILFEFNQLILQNNGNIPISELETFINTNFKSEKLNKWFPPDFSDLPPILNFIEDYKYKEFMSGVNQIWKSLARKVSSYVNITKAQNSMVYVPNGFFVNVENQEEFYYWDTYWIIRGALICGMHNTVKGILENLIYLIKEFGFVISANRVYFEGRTQLPLLTQMMATYYKYTNDKSFLLENLEFLDNEMMFWLVYRQIQVKSLGNIYNLAHYKNDLFDPRPEMYKADVSIAEPLKSSTDKYEFWGRTKAAFESGWGFSSRHFPNRIKTDDIKRTLLKTNPLNFVFVELNAVLQSNANILSNMYQMKNDNNNTYYYKQLAHRFQIGINALLWNEDEKMWSDYDISKSKSRQYFYASNLAPLWTKSYDEKLSEFYGDAAVDYLIRKSIINEDLTPRFICIPTSLYNTGLEWDYYNCMPQLQSMVIFGLQSTKSLRAQKVAFNLASSWVYTTYFEYNKTRILSTKYNAIKLGKGNYTKLLDDGELESKGCGVTIGLLFEIFNTWGDTLRSS